MIMYIRRTLCLLLLSILSGPGLLPGSDALAKKPDPLQPTVLITGSSRGIGFALASQYAERGWGVIATCRTPAKAKALQALAKKYPGVLIEELDVTEFDEIDALAKRYKDVPIDVLINNAGILGGNERQKFGTFDYEALDEVLEVNTVGPIRMLEVFVDHVAASEQKKVMNISSYMASIQMNFGGQNFYRVSKSALNQSMRTIAKELKRSDVEARKAVIIGLIDPGVVETDFAKNVPIPMISPAESAAGVIVMIDEYTLKKSGTFVRYDGKTIPW
jgi:NAD(P)-dependent dehydrogenase (short-subunit alcohol dehydrogenase family)